MKSLFKYSINFSLALSVFFNSTVPLFATDGAALLYNKRKEVEEVYTARAQKIMQIKLINKSAAKDKQLMLAAERAALEKEYKTYEANLNHSAIKRAEEIKAILLNKSGSQRPEAPTLAQFKQNENISKAMNARAGAAGQEINQSYRQAYADAEAEAANMRAQGQNEEEIALFKKETDANITTLLRKAKNALKVAVNNEWKNLHKAYLKQYNSAYSNENVFKAVKKLSNELVHTHLKNEDKASTLPYILELTPLVLNYKHGSEEIFSPKIKIYLKSVFENVLRNASKECLKTQVTLDAKWNKRDPCSQEVTALAALGVLGGPEDGQTVLNFLNKKYAGEDRAQILLLSLDALLAMKAYGSIDTLLSNAKAREKRGLFTTIADHLFIAGWTKTLGDLGDHRETFYGEFSATFLLSKTIGKEKKTAVTTNAWTEAALKLASDGTPDALKLLQKHGTDNCDIAGNSAHKLFLKCEAMWPFVAGALMSGKSGANNKHSYTLNERWGVDVQELFAIFLANINFKDISVSEEVYIDATLRGKYPARNSQFFRSYAATGAAGRAVKQKLTAATEKKLSVANNIDLALMVYFLKDLPKIGVSIARGVSGAARGGIKALRTGLKAKNFKHVVTPEVMKTYLKHTAFDPSKTAFKTDFAALSKELGYQQGKISKIAQAKARLAPALETAAKNAEWAHAWAQEGRLIGNAKYGNILAQKTQVALYEAGLGKDAAKPFSKNLRALRQNARPVAELPLKKHVILLNKEYKEITEEILTSIKTDAKSKFFTRTPLNLKFQGKVHGVKMGSLEEVVIYKNGDSKYWLSFLTKSKDNKLLIMDPSHFKITIDGATAGKMLKNISGLAQEEGVFKGLKFYPANLKKDHYLRALNSVKDYGFGNTVKNFFQTTRKDYHLQQFGILDKFGNKIDGLAIKTARELNGNINFFHSADGSIRTLNSAGNHVEGFFGVPKEMLGAFAKNTGGKNALVNATLTAGRNKVGKSMLLSGVNYGINGIALGGAIDDTYSSQEMPDFNKLMLAVGVPSLGALSSPLFNRVIRKSGAANALGYGYLASAGALLIPSLAGLNGFGNVTKEEHPSPWSLYIMSPLIAVSSALTKGSMNMIVHSMDKKGTSFAAATAYKSIFTPAMLTIPALINVNTVDENGVFNPRVNPFVANPLMAAVSIGSFAMLKKLHLSSAIGKTAAGRGKVLKLTGARRKDLLTSGALVLGAGLSFEAMEASSSKGYGNKQLNRLLEGLPYLKTRDDVRYLAQSGVSIIPAVFSRISYGKMFKLLGGTNNTAAYYKFLGINQALALTGTAIYKNTQADNPLGFGLGTFLVTFGSANNFTTLYKLGIRNLEAKKFSRAFTNKLQLASNITGVGGTLGVASLRAAYQGDLDAGKYTSEEERHNEHLQDNQWVPVMYGGAGSLLTMFTINKALPFKLLKNAAGPAYGVNVLSHQSAPKAHSVNAPALSPDVAENIKNSISAPEITAK